MHVRFLFGSAGSGKTFRCLADIREELARAPEGPELLLLAPKQATFQLERQLLADGRVQGYTRLQILSFERLAVFVLQRLNRPLPELLSEEGRVMVLRAILAEKHAELRVFRAGARLAGFARQLSALLRECQRRGLGPDPLQALAAKPGLPPSLADRLSDLALLLRAFLDWVDRRSASGRIEDAARLMDTAIKALKREGVQLRFAGLWLDGFAEMTPQETELLAAVLPCCDRATLAFCLQRPPTQDEPWLSPWAVVSATARQCLGCVEAIPGMSVFVETLPRDGSQGRFVENPVLRHLDQSFAGVLSREERARFSENQLRDSLRLVECTHAEAEAMLAAREIRQFVRAGGRYRDCAVLVRSLDGYQDVLRRVLSRYEIPFFLDRREGVAHHPLAELTRFALRTVTFDWRLTDWLGTLKSGLTALTDHEVDQLENAALARGWEGAAIWLNPLATEPENADASRAAVDVEPLRRRVVAPLVALQQHQSTARWQPTGAVLARALRELWRELRVEQQLQTWAQNNPGDRTGLPGTAHMTVWEQMNDWLDNLDRAFADVAMPMNEWLSIVEAGLSGLTVGVIPPALDQVLVGSVDRSRNPDLKLALVLGVNESIFPSPPKPLPLLNDSDALELEDRGVALGPGRRQFGHERYFGYIAFTRARQRLVVTWSASDAEGRTRNPSRFVDELRRAFPQVEVERFDGHVDWSESEHAVDLAGSLATLRHQPEFQALCTLPSVRPLMERWHAAEKAVNDTRLSPEVAAALYGRVLAVSVSALESFAACPFQFLVSRGLRAEERDEFAVDSRRTGEFQHEVLQQFHTRLFASGRRWRDLPPDEAAQWLRDIGAEQMRVYRHGLFLADPARRFFARALLGKLERIIRTLTSWARQCEFDPAAVEVSFGMEADGWPGWQLDLGGDRAVMVRGRVDRIDLCRLPDGSALAAILDYKSGGKEFKEVKFQHGLELQMPVYLNALCENPAARTVFGFGVLLPAGVFYVGLRLRAQSASARGEVERNEAAVPVQSCQHRGRFDLAWLQLFDNRNVPSGDQFKYRFKKDGEPYKTGNDAMAPGAFAAMLDGASQQVRDLGKRILEGEAAVSPYQLGTEKACDRCAFLSVCRFDSWTQPYRTLKRRVVLDEVKEERE